MKVKSLMAVAAVVTAGVALAKVEATTTLCQIKVDCSYTNTVIALPLVEVGGTTDTINPTNAVLPTGLNVGTTMYTKVSNVKVKGGGWMLNSDGWTYYPGEEADPSNISTTEAGGDVSVAPGSAVWLYRQSTTDPIYIRGQICDSAITNEITRTYSMIGNASTNTVRLTALHWDVRPNVGDKVMFIDDSPWGVTNEFICASDSSESSVRWTYVKATSETTTLGGREVTSTDTQNIAVEPGTDQDLQILPGMGFYYYKDKKGSRNPKVVW